MSASSITVEPQSGCVLGGIFHARRQEPVAPEWLRAMAARVTSAPATVMAGADPLGLFGAGVVTFERSGEVWAVADLDLLNLNELHALAGQGPGRGELLTRLYAREGLSFVRRLRGAFAIAIWDRRRRVLLLAVDHFGMRRLHYTTDGRRVAFASRLGAVRAVPGLVASVDPAAVYAYLNFTFVPAPDTAFQGIRRLPPGYFLEAGPGDIRVEPFWDMAYPEERPREDRAASAMYRATQRAVSDALRDLRPKETGAFLSGGTDSSTVVGLMTRTAGESVNAFSIGFEEGRYDERAYAEIAARHFGAAHYHRVITADDAIAVLPRLVEVYDEPLGNNSALGTFFCAQLASECGVTTLLAGDGGDEIFGGNERYRTDRIFASYGRLPGLLRRGILEPTLLNLPESAPGILGRAQRYIKRAKLPNPRRFYSYEFYVAQNAAALLDPDFLGTVAQDAPWVLLEAHFQRVKASSELNRLMYLDLKLIIGDNDLLKVTRTAELAGARVRFPLLSLPLVEFTGTLPADFKVRGLEKRHLFKRAFGALLPRETLAKRKHGFGVPTADWLRTHPGFRELARDTLLAPVAGQRGYFRRGALERLFALHAGESSPFYGDILWTALVLELWHRRHVDNRGAA